MKTRQNFSLLVSASALALSLGSSPAFSGMEEARRWIDIATARGVTLVCAHTLAAETASTAVLRRLGFRRTAELVDPEVGAVWRWELAPGTKRP